MTGDVLPARDKPAGVRLYMHCAPRAFGSDLRRIARRLGIHDRLLPFADDIGRPRVSDERLTAIYNACDVGVNTSMGEGWGLIAFEHAATGAPQIVPRHSACQELWRDAGIFLSAVPTVEFGVARATPTAEELGAALQRLYVDRVHYARTAAACQATARAHQYRWDAIVQRWDEFIRTLVHTRMSHEVRRVSYA